jgi:hypothetical protein
MSCRKQKISPRICADDTDQKREFCIDPCHPCLSAAIFFFFGLALCATSANAHPARLVSGVATINPNGDVTISLTIDLPAFLLNDTPQRVSDADMNALIDGPTDALSAALADAQDRLLHSTKLKNGQIESATVPSVDHVEQAKGSPGPTRFPLMMDVQLAGHLSSGARAFSVNFPEALGSIVLTVERPDSEARAFAIDGGDFSPEVPVNVRGEGEATTRPGGNAALPAPSEPSRLSVAARYVVLGFEHILPQGPDHVLFILGLFLLSTRLSTLLWQISAFTIAHSITLGLALYGVVRLPPSIVEPAIAGSIAFIAIENLWTTKLHVWRPMVVFAFGLIHGMGFASVLLDMGLPRRDFAPALVAFNIGVELGQIAVVIIAMLVVGWFRKRTWYRSVVVVPASAGIALCGIAWMVQRLI